MRIFCSVCKDIFIPYSEVKITTCGHFYHGECISRWIKQHKTCPQCRATLKSQPFKVYFDVEKESDLDVNTLQHQVETLADKLRESESLNKELKEKKESCEATLQVIKAKASDWKEKHDLLNISVKGLKEQVSRMLLQTEVIDALEIQLKMWQGEAEKLKSVNDLINTSSDNTNKMLESTPCTEKGFKQLCTFISVLKSQADKSKAKSLALGKENVRLMKCWASEKKKFESQSKELLRYKISLRNSEQETKSEECKILYKSIKKPKLVNTSRPSTSTVQVDQSAINSDLECIFDANKKNDVTANVTANITANRTANITQRESMVCAGPSRNFQRPSSSSCLRDRQLSEAKSFSSDRNKMDCSKSIRTGSLIRSGSPVFRDTVKKLKSAYKKS